MRDELVDSHRRGGRRQVVKAAACGAAIRGFESPRSPSFFKLLIPKEHPRGDLLPIEQDLCKAIPTDLPQLPQRVGLPGGQAVLC